MLNRMAMLLLAGIQLWVYDLAYPSIAILGEAMGLIWNVMREEYIRRLAAIQQAHDQVTQKHIAARGGIHQNDVSRILSNEQHGPTAEIFIGGVVGLGTTPSEFFTAIEPQFPVRKEAATPWALAAMMVPTQAPRWPDDYTEEQWAQLGRWAFRIFCLWQASPRAMPAGRSKKHR